MLSGWTEETIGDDSALVRDRWTIPIREEKRQQRKCQDHQTVDCFAAEASRPVNEVERFGSSQKLLGRIRIRQVIPPPRCNILAQERNLHHPTRRAQPNFPELLHRSDCDDGFPRHLNGYYDQRTDDQKPDEKRE